VKVRIKCPLKSFHFVHSNRLFTIQSKKNSLNYILFIVQYEFLVNGEGIKKKKAALVTIEIDKLSLSRNYCSRSSSDLGLLKPRSGYCP